jgi:hypothetical protein
MRFGSRIKTRWFFGIVQSILLCGLFSAEIHGLLGHTDFPLPGQDRHVENAGPSFELDSLRSDRDRDESTCNLCICYRLLGHLLFPQKVKLDDSQLVARVTFNQHSRLPQIPAPEGSNRAPPHAG